MSLLIYRNVSKVPGDSPKKEKISCESGRKGVTDARGQRSPQEVILLEIRKAKKPKLMTTQLNRTASLNGSFFELINPSANTSNITS